MLVPSKPRLPHFFTSSRCSVQSFCSSRSLTGMTSPLMNSDAVCRISLCSSVSFSGVITVDGSVSAISHAPPFTAASLATLAIGPRFNNHQPAIRYLLTFEDASGSHTAADAHRHHAVSRLAAVHLVDQRRGQLRTGAPERVSQRDGTAVDVHLIGIEVELLHAGQRLGGERLVELDEVDLIECQPGLLQKIGRAHV